MPVKIIDSRKRRLQKNNWQRITWQDCCDVKLFQNIFPQDFFVQWKIKYNQKGLRHGNTHKLDHFENIVQTSQYKEGELHSGSKKGPRVKSRRQAIAIALSEARKHAK